MKEVFDAIAPGWYSFRHRTIFRAELEALAQRWGRGRLLNVGCGHGADFVPFRHGFELHGVDFSGAMLKLAGKYSAKFEFAVNLVLGDMTSLPYRDGAFDCAISVAAYHHIKGRKDRLQSLEELRRVLKPGGEAFITVWNRWQPRFWLSGKEVMVPWRAKAGTLYRYYYLFTYGELEKLAREAGLEVLRSRPESGYHFPLQSFSRNICILVRRRSATM